jgi:hypothetical protein
MGNVGVTFSPSPTARSSVALWHSILHLLKPGPGNVTTPDRWPKQTLRAVLQPSFYHNRILVSCWPRVSPTCSPAMRYENWDVILFPRDSLVPIQEFKTACYATQNERKMITPDAYFTCLFEHRWPSAANADKLHVFSSSLDAIPHLNPFVDFTDQAFRYHRVATKGQPEGSICCASHR